jgi:hypothetical protein
VYGEWLRRENRRVDAREQLGAAYEMFCDFGADAFAERARRELQATGETVPKRTVETRDELTAQEALVRPRDAWSLSGRAESLGTNHRTVGSRLDQQAAARRDEPVRATDEARGAGWLGRC